MDSIQCCLLLWAKGVARHMTMGVAGHMTVRILWAHEHDLWPLQHYLSVHQNDLIMTYRLVAAPPTFIFMDHTP